LAKETAKLNEKQAELDRVQHLVDIKTERINQLGDELYEQQSKGRSNDKLNLRQQTSLSRHKAAALNLTGGGRADLMVEG
jgi:hypothetical protein